MLVSSDFSIFHLTSFSISLEMVNSIYWAQLRSETDCEYWTDSARKEYLGAKD